MRVRFSLKSKLLLLSSVMFVLPWLGYQYVWEMESFLRLGQEKTLSGTAQAVATALHERPVLFEQHAAYQQVVVPGKDLYAYQLKQPIRLDGDLSEWTDFSKRSVYYNQQNLLPEFKTLTPSSISFNHTVGQYQQHLYLAFDVQDNHVVLREPNSYRIDKNDYLEISIEDNDGVFKRYIFASNQQAGWVNAYPVDINNRAELPERKIQGYWQNSPEGYRLELRLPVSWVGAKAGFAIYDVDDKIERSVVSAIGTANTQKAADLGTILVPSPEIDSIIKGLSYNQSRIWVVDKHGRVLAKSGSIYASAQKSAKPDSHPLMQSLQSFLQPLYDTILTQPAQTFIDQLKDAVQLQDQALLSALKGVPDTLWRLSPDKQAVIISAAHPIFIGGEVLGAVVVEETTHGIRSLRNQALESLFNQIVLLLLAGSCVFLLFAFRISGRIQTLQSQLIAAVDKQGRITGNVKAEKTQDELGDLSRSVSDLVQRLAEYNLYLQSMSSRMSHEFKTPLAVIRSSIDALKQQESQLQGNAFVIRANEGLQRLDAMLTAMTEATRLEQSIQNEDKEIFDLAQVVEGCIAGHTLAFSKQKFALEIQKADYRVMGSPDLIAQMMDKILANAIEFSVGDNQIEIELKAVKSKAILEVKNVGQPLPETMYDRLFDSMVSIRKENTATQQQKPHLGLGLYIARLVSQFHEGKISAFNRQDGQPGVCLQFEIQRLNLTQ